MNIYKLRITDHTKGDPEDGQLFCITPFDADMLPIIGASIYVDVTGGVASPRVELFFVARRAAGYEILRTVRSLAPLLGYLERVAHHRAGRRRRPPKRRSPENDGRR